MNGALRKRRVDLFGEGTGSNVDCRGDWHGWKQGAGKGGARSTKIIQPRDVLRYEDAGRKDQVHDQNVFRNAISASLSLLLSPGSRTFSGNGGRLK